MNLVILEVFPNRNDSVVPSAAVMLSVMLSVLPLAGGWMKMERSFYLKKRRADFVAGYLKGRVVVAGGLGEALGTVVTL